MTEVTRPAESAKNEFVISNRSGLIEISSPFVSLASGRNPLRFEVTLEKIPTQIEDGISIDNITIDRESPKLQVMLRQAQELREIPERERPRQVLQLLRSNVHYAYDDVLEELAKTNPDLATWVAENTGAKSSSSKPITLSEIVNSGHGVCRHLSVAMLALAQEAGMEGVYLNYSPPMTKAAEAAATDADYIKQVVRKDNGQPLFKSDPIGRRVYEGHAWVELRTSDGEWIPVDPSTQLVGDTQEGVETFRDANYRAAVGSSLDVEGFSGDVRHSGNKDLRFLPGEARHTGILEINSQPRQKVLRLSRNKPENEQEDQEQWPKPTTYEGPLKFTLGSHQSNAGMTVAVIDAKVA